MEKKKNTKKVSCVIAAIVAIVGCIIHSSENTPSPTVYYIIIVLVTCIGFLVGVIIDIEGSDGINGEK